MASTVTIPILRLWGTRHIFKSGCLVGSNATRLARELATRRIAISLTPVVPFTYIQAMPDKKPDPPTDDPAQYQRFLDMAREVEAEESPDAMDRAFAKVIRPGSATKPNVAPGHAVRRKPNRDN
jgi:hypothetical protein